MIEVELPDGSVAEFPDGTSSDAIKGALAKYRTPQAQAPAQSEYTPTGTTGENFRAGMGRSVDKLLDGLTQLYLQARGEKPALQGLEQNIQEKRALDQPLTDTTAGVLGEISGDIGMTALPGAKAVKGAQIFTKALRPAARVAAQMGAAGGVAGVYGALKPVTGDDTRFGNAATDAAFGAAGQGVGMGIGRAIQGLVPMSRQARALPAAVQDEATLGQVADRNTFAGSLASGLEERLKSVPIAGQIVEKARNRGLDAWRGNMLEGVAPPGYVPKGGTTREMIDDIGEEFANRYGAVLKNVTISPSQQFGADLRAIINNPRSGLTAAEVQKVDEVVKNYLGSMFHIQQAPGGGRAFAATGDQAKQFESFLTKLAKQYRRSADPKSGSYADMFEAIEDAWTKAYRSQLPAQAAAVLRPLDQRYAPYKTVERAASYLAAAEGDFTPAQLLSSVRARSTVPEFARGRGLIQDVAEQGKQVYQDKLANSGTADRSLLASALLGIGTGIDPTTAATTLGVAVPALTTKAGRNVLTGTTRAQKLLQALRADQAARLGGGPLGSGLYNEDSE